MPKSYEVLRLLGIVLLAAGFFVPLSGAFKEIDPVYPWVIAGMTIVFVAILFVLASISESLQELVDFMVADGEEEEGEVEWDMEAS